MSHSPGHDGLEHAVQLGVLVGVVGDELIGLLVLRDVQKVLAVVSDGGRGGRIRRRAADLILMKSDAALQNVLYISIILETYPNKCNKALYDRDLP